MFQHRDFLSNNNVSVFILNLSEGINYKLMHAEFFCKIIKILFSKLLLDNDLNFVLMKALTFLSSVSDPIKRARNDRPYLYLSLFNQISIKTFRHLAGKKKGVVQWLN
jgi:hypothetical protein